MLDEAPQVLQISLKAARVNAVMTQNEVASKLHCTKQTIINWENGYTTIKQKNLLELSDLYQIPIENLRLPSKESVLLHKEAAARSALNNRSSSKR